MVLYPVIRKLLEKRVVLASASRRHQEILRNAGLQFKVVPPRFKEKLRKVSFPTPYAYAMEAAKQKALAVTSRMHQKDLWAPDIVIGADTVVAVGDLILEKPVDKLDAYSMLSRLNGREHSVFTGVAIMRCSSQDGQLDTDVLEFYEETRVQFSQLSDELLWEYIHSGEPLDKVGGYDIQARGGMLVEHIHGEFLNIVGFPLNRFCKKLAELYCPPHPKDLQQVNHNPIPAVDTSEKLSDVGSGASSQGRAPVGCGQPQTQGRKGTQDADPKPTVESLLPTAIIQVMDAYKASKVLFTACKMKVFDFLRDEGPLSASEIARKIDASEYGTGQLLATCVALGLLDKTERGYSNMDLASLYLLLDSEHSLDSYIMFNNDVMWLFFSYLEFAVQERANQHPRLLGKTGKHPYENSFYQSREKKLQFMAAMHSLTKVSAHQVATAFDLSRFTSACNLRGCTGALAHELARQYPCLEVTVFDSQKSLKMPSVFSPMDHREGRSALCQKLHRLGALNHKPLSCLHPGDQLSEVQVSRGHTPSTGNIFIDTLPGADLYVVSRVFQNWSDDKVHEILRRISSSCKPGGGLLVVETLLDEEKHTALYPLLMSLTMLTMLQGRERSLSEYRSLLETHGFTSMRAVYTGSVTDVILAIRA